MTLSITLCRFMEIPYVCLCCWTINKMFRMSIRLPNQKFIFLIRLCFHKIRIVKLQVACQILMLHKEGKSNIPYLLVSMKSRQGIKLLKTCTTQQLPFQLYTLNQLCIEQTTMFDEKSHNADVPTQHLCEIEDLQFKTLKDYLIIQGGL